MIQRTAFKALLEHKGHLLLLEVNLFSREFGYCWASLVLWNLN